MARVTRKPQAPSSYGKPNLKCQREEEEEGHLSMQILRQVQIEMTPSNLFSSFPLTPYPLDYFPVFVWHIPSPRTVPFSLKPLFPSIPHPFLPNQCHSLLILLSLHVFKEGKKTLSRKFKNKSLSKKSQSFS